MPFVYFHIDEVARDAVVASALKRKLAAQGVTLIYGNRVESTLLKRSDPFDLYIFPSVDLFKAYFPDLDKLQSPVVILPSESVGGLTSNVRRLAAKYFGSFPEEYQPWTERITAFCLWGPSHVKSFETYGPHLLGKVEVIGHPRFDRSCSSGMRQPGQVVRVGIISRFASLNSFSGSSMLYNIFAGRRSYYSDGKVSPRFAVHLDRDWEDLLFNEAVDLRLLFEVVDALAARNVHLELRVHPRENRTAWASLIKQQNISLSLAPWDTPFQHWAMGMDQIIGPTSTSFFDCFAIGRQPICTNALAPKRADHVIGGGDDDNPILKFVKMPKSIDELVTVALESEKQMLPADYPSELVHILEQEAWYPHCQTSLDRMASICVKCLTRVPSKRKLAQRLRHMALVPAGNINQVLRYGWRPGSEQSSSFLLTPYRMRWIDNLSKAGAAPH